jgi:succinate dehydrogenase/fumarate reductase flavoprotein subunit
LFLDRIMVTRLIRHGSGVAGALGIRLSDGNVIALSAKAVIVATGGGACLYGRTDNPAGTTADGIALAYSAGAELVDIECVSFALPEARLPELLAVHDPPDEGLLQVGAAHYFLGGIRVDERCRTTVPGVFAAGEVTGGLFGAARLGGSAMADTIVFGAIAGGEAARYVRRRPVAPIDPALVAQATRLLDQLRGGHGTAPDQFAADLAGIMWRNCGTMKTAQTLRRAVAALDDLGRPPALRAGSPMELRRALECRHMLDVARLIVAASLVREETRGCFWRLDFPRPDNARWVANIFLRQEGDRIAHAVRPAALTRLTQPTAPRIGGGCFPYLPAGRHQG